MTTKTDTKADPVDSFDVVCKIGTVNLDGSGPYTPYQAAFRLIADHDAEGTYHFPMPEGGVCAVTVEYGV